MIITAKIVPVREKKRDANLPKNKRERTLFVIPKSNAERFPYKYKTRTRAIFESPSFMPGRVIFKDNMLSK